MGCAASSASVQATRAVQFAQVVPDDTFDIIEAGHIDDKRDKRDLPSANKAGWLEDPADQKDASERQGGGQDVPERQAGAQASAAYLAVGPAPAGASAPEQPASPRQADDGHENGHERLIDPKRERGEEKRQGKSERKNTLSFDEKDRLGLTTKQASEGQHGSNILNAGIVSEPKSLVTWKSFDFNPSAEDFALGQPIPPCAPTHRKYLRRINRNLEHFASLPEAFQAFIQKRRDRFDQKAQRLDAQTQVAGEQSTRQQVSRRRLLF
eukprot:TRINITY_DN92294_c0_g1_i1.p1 TRINITY_DN92294_c0_g1~~TRINITY_DN92294_c0_g1_i1.p1  ORF type:complete len:267 (-),score=49.84 TRINITY_DN92294_c0_g1_i1:84-884(-)